MKEWSDARAIIGSTRVLAGLLDAAPCGPTGNAGDSYPADRELKSQIVMERTVRPEPMLDLGHLSDRQLGATATGPILVHPISDVVIVGPKPKMSETRTGDTADHVDARLIIADAGRVVTCVERPEARGDGATVRQFPSNLMRARGLVATSDVAVPLSVSRTRPLPTGIRLVDLCPESFTNGPSLTATSGKSRTRRIAEVLAVRQQAGTIHRDGGSAGIALSNNRAAIIGILVAHRTHLRCQAPGSTTYAGVISCLDFTTNQR